MDGAAALREAGIHRIAVPPDQVAAFRAVGLEAEPMDAFALAARHSLPAPGIAFRADEASPTRSPWINANGWRFRRRPDDRFRSEAPAGKAVLAAAEAVAWGGDVVLVAEPSDLPRLGAFQAFVAQGQAVPGLDDVADFGVVDDGSPLVGEVQNLLTRRNLLFRLVTGPRPELAFTIAVGSREYPKEAAADPSAFALRVRRQLGDDRRSLRLYGSEVVLCRLTAGGGRARLHLVNYGGREATGLRVRLRGAYSAGVLRRPGEPPNPLDDVLAEEGTTEFSIPLMREYAVVDLTSAR